MEVPLTLSIQDTCKTKDACTRKGKLNGLIFISINAFFVGMYNFKD